MNKLKNNKVINIIIFFLIFIFAYSVNIANIKYGYLNSNDIGLVYGATLYSPDNIWYLPQIKNFLAGNGFTSDPNDLIQSVRRTPGYPLFYGFHYLMFGEINAHKMIVISQCLIFALSAVALGIIGSWITKNLLIGYFISLAYGSSLFIISFLFLTITESISPAFIIFSFYYLFRALQTIKNDKVYLYLFGAIFASIATLIKPTNGLFILSFFIAIYVYDRKKINHIKYYIFSIIGFSILIIPWTIRNYYVFEKFIPLETYKIQAPYDGQGFKITGLKNWYYTFGAFEVLELHYGMLGDLNGHDRYKTINEFIEREVPLNVYVGYSREDLYKSLIEYQNCIELDMKRNGGERLKWGEKPHECEYEVAAIFVKYGDSIRESKPLLAYFIAPVVYRGSKYIFHSGLHTFKSLQGRNIGLISKIIKAYAYIINVLLWFFSILFIINYSKNKIKIILIPFVIIKFIFVTYTLQVEGRYLISIYPFMYLMSILWLHEIYKKIENKKMIH